MSIIREVYRGSELVSSGTVKQNTAEVLVDEIPTPNGLIFVAKTITVEPPHKISVEQGKGRRRLRKSAINTTGVSGFLPIGEEGMSQRVVVYWWKPQH